METGMWSPRACSHSFVLPRNSDAIYRSRACKVGRALHEHHFLAREEGRGFVPSVPRPLDMSCAARCVGIVQERTARSGSCYRLWIQQAVPFRNQSRAGVSPGVIESRQSSLDCSNRVGRSILHRLWTKERGTAMPYLVWVALLGVVAGWLAGQITKGSGFGLLGDLVVGIVGSLLGSFIFGLLGLGAYSLLGRLVVSVAGAIVLLWLIRLIKRA